MHHFPCAGGGTCATSNDRNKIMKSALISKQFQIDGRLFDIQGMSFGNVNDTYLAIYWKVFWETEYSSSESTVYAVSLHI